MQCYIALYCSMLSYTVIYYVLFYYVILSYITLYRSVCMLRYLSYYVIEYCIKHCHLEKNLVLVPFHITLHGVMWSNVIYHAIWLLQHIFDDWGMLFFRPPNLFFRPLVIYSTPNAIFSTPQRYLFDPQCYFFDPQCYFFDPQCCFFRPP